MTTASRLLRTERDALLPILRARAAADFELPTVLPLWSVRDVLAHCSAALNLTAAQAMHSGSPAENQVDVEHRRDWTIDRLLDELAGGYDGAADVVEAIGGRYEAVALGEWTHGGDVRMAWGIEDAYASAGVDDALALLNLYSMSPRSELPPTAVLLTDREPLRLGTADPVATLTTDTATFVRMWAGRDPDPARFTLTGAEAEEFVVFH
jgi:uncharacterized protein (TIGR03083 family)